MAEKPMPDIASEAEADAALKRLEETTLLEDMMHAAAEVWPPSEEHSTKLAALALLERQRIFLSSHRAPRWWVGAFARAEGLEE